MKTSDLVFVGIRGSVIALDRATGQQVWTTRLKGYDFVNVVLEGELLFASSYGEMFCLESQTGRVRWHNPLKGFGVGLSAIATGMSGCGANASVLAEKDRLDKQAAD
jgi:outer membrane protein assembly factor BamB